MSRSDVYSLLPPDLQPPTDMRSMGFKVRLVAIDWECI